MHVRCPGCLQTLGTDTPICKRCVQRLPARYQQAIALSPDDHAVLRNAANWLDNRARKSVLLRRQAASRSAASRFTN